MNLSLQLGFFSGAPGPGELVVVFLVVLLLFGSRSLPDFARTLGSLMQQLRRASNDFRDQLMSIEDEFEATSYTSEVDLDESDMFDEYPEDGDVPEDDDVPEDEDMLVEGDVVDTRSDSDEEDQHLAG